MAVVEAVKTILLLGKNGQVGWELQRALAPLGTVVALDRYRSDSLCGDISDLEGLRETIERIKPDVLVNAAAYTAVDRAESEPDLADLLNHKAPALMASLMGQLDGTLIHYSTDYVFDGSGDRPWKELDVAAPLNVYGTTKFAGEQAIQSSGCKHLIFRTSWVYGNRGNNFAKTMLRLAAERESLKVVDDQVGAPTSAALIADVSVRALQCLWQRPEVTGLYHLAAAGETSWYGYARYVLEWAQRAEMPLLVKSIQAVTSEEYKVPAERPKNSRLNCESLSATFGVQLPKWKQGVERMLQESLRSSNEQA